MQYCHILPLSGLLHSQLTRSGTGACCDTNTFAFEHLSVVHIVQMFRRLGIAGLLTIFYNRENWTVLAVVSRCPMRMRTLLIVVAKVDGDVNDQLAPAQHLENFFISGLVLSNV